jgi:hypothetical protein
MKTLLDWLPKNVSLSPEIHDKLITSIHGGFIIISFRGSIEPSHRHLNNNKGVNNENRSSLSGQWKV